MCKIGHIKADYHVLKMKQKLEEKNEVEKHMKKKKAYIAWEENDSSTSSESDDSTEEENNLCLMAGTGSSKSSMSKRRGEIKWLEGRLKQLEEENENLITCLEKLEKSEKYPRSRCEHCPGQLETIEYLMNLAIFQIPATLKTVGFLKGNFNGYPKALQNSLT